MTTNITMRIDKDLKEQLQELLTNLGLDMTTYFTLAAKQAVREQSVPFEITMNTPNIETIEAFKEVEEIKKNPNIRKTYNNAEEMVKDILG